MTSGSSVTPPPSTRAARLEAKTRNLILSASRRDFVAASRDLDDTMKGALSPSAFAALWDGIEGKLGKLTAIESVTVEEGATHWTDVATCAFEKDRVGIALAYDAKDAIAGLHLVAPKSATAWSTPDYAQPDSFVERAVTVGTEHPLPGTLTLPKGTSPAPVVVLVHGSGPNDADESIGGARPFKDLAWGLASHGVAVLRYVKRTKQDPSGVVTQKEEVLDGVRDAIALLRHTDGVDPARIFVLGHSQGGYLAPRIARENSGLAGLIILAGSTRPLTETVLEQLAFVAARDPKNAAALNAQIDATKQLQVKLADPALRPDETVTFLGVSIPAAYFLDMRGYDPAAVAAGLHLPILVLQGERDYQVSTTELAGWKRTLGNRRNATIKTYPGLNHLFVRGEGEPSPAEYLKPGHVDRDVVRDIADWVTRASTAA